MVLMRNKIHLPVLRAGGKKLQRSDHFTNAHTTRISPPPSPGRRHPKQLRGVVKVAGLQGNPRLAASRARACAWDSVRTRSWSPRETATCTRPVREKKQRHEWPWIMAWSHSGSQLVNGQILGILNIFHKRNHFPCGNSIGPLSQC